MSPTHDKGALKLFKEDTPFACYFVDSYLEEAVQKFTGIRDVTKILRVGSARLNLPEPAFLINCPIVTNHYLFQCLKDRRTSIGIE